MTDLTKDRCRSRLPCFSIHLHSACAVDDTEAVWRGARNLIVIEPYRFWQVRKLLYISLPAPTAVSQITEGSFPSLMAT